MSDTDKKQALLFSYNVTMGCDPEFFFKGADGQTAGAEEVLPDNGITYQPGTATYDGAHTSAGNVKASKIVIDGVQAELNPRPNTCRANLGNEISACFRDLNKQLQKKGNNMGVSFAPLVRLSQKKLDSLSEKAKVFGCAPSTNLYTQGTSKITVNPRKYLKRSAGGHVHLGSQGCKYISAALKNVEEMVYMLDIIVGNTCVLLDRNPNNVERRKVYGRAGEYRSKEYGLEYRTLSNFWLQSYQLMSMVMGLSRMAVHIVAQSDPAYGQYYGVNGKRNFAEDIKSRVRREDIFNAIQNNDFALAYSNFLKIQDIIVEIASDTYAYPINRTNIAEFHWFVRKGINYWFKHDPFNHWITLPEGHNRGFETFLGGRVHEDMANAAESKEKLQAQMKKIQALEQQFDALKGFEPAIEAEKPVKKPRKKAAPAAVEVKPAVEAVAK